MNVAFVSIVWACLQIGVLCLLSLSIAWLLRGRRPQWVTSMLAGTCVASLLLALIALVPTWQWTLVVENQTQANAVHPHSIEHLASEITNEVRLDATTTVPRESIETAPIATLDAGEVDSRHVDTFLAIRHFLSRALQSVDHEVRMADDWQQPLATARNYSVGLVLICGLIVMSLLWCSSWLYVRRIIATSQSIEDASILSMVSSHARGFGLKFVPAVRESSHVPIGATVGWHRVTVLLHSDWREWSEQERSAVVAHELAHASRHDFVWVVVASWTRILLFFHPLVHALILRLRMEQELAADQLAAGKVGNAKAYGRALASLALRSQQSLGTSNPKLGSMLAAGQICVTRRVMMLKQGSLKPVQSRSRWSLAVMMAIACSAIPVAGLRGTTQESNSEQATTEDRQGNQDASAQVEKPKPLSKEFLAAYPPLEFKGSMTYRPGRFRAGEFGPQAAWFQDLFVLSMLGQPFPDNATVHGQCNYNTRWLDEARMHGSFDMSASFREGGATLPGQLSALSNLPIAGLGRPMRTVSTEQYMGRTISAVTNSQTSDVPEKWLIDDSHGFFLGTREEVERYLHGQSFAMESIPEDFREDYKNAAFAMVFQDCESWHSQFESFAKGSPRESEFLIAMQLIKDVKRIAFFADGCKSPACTIRAVAVDATSAGRLAAHANTMKELGKLAMLASKSPTEDSTAEVEMQRSILETMTITTRDSEVVFQFDIFVPSIDGESAFAEGHGIAGWQGVHSVPKVQESNLSQVQVPPSSEIGLHPSLLAQTLDATSYLGKTVALEMEIQCNEQALDQAGVFLCASHHEEVKKVIYGDRTPLRTGSPYTGHRTVAVRTNACDGVGTFRTALQADRMPERNSSRAPWRTVSVQMKVPNDSQHLSFGCYTKNSIIQVRNARLQIVNRADESSSSNTGHDALADMPYSVLVKPGYKIRKEPINLDFEAISPDPIHAASQAETVVR